MFSVALKAPVVDGVNVSLTVQEELAATVPPFTQVPVPVFEKLFALVPVMVKYGVAMTCEDVPVLETVTVTTLLVVPTFWLPKVAGLGARESVGAPINGCG